jgi:hypothetical protein
MAKKVRDEAVNEMVEEAPVEVAPKPKRKRLSKVIDGGVLTIVEAVTETSTAYDFATLPEGIQALLGPFGMSQKLGDAAAGKKGEEAVNAINKVWEGLQAGNWSVRAPAAEKITKKSITGKFDAMEDGPEKEMAAELLKKLGITI